jgi:hypothetical protein
MAASALSVLMHVGLVYLLMGQSLGTYGSSLFRSDRPQEPRLLSIERSDDDLIVDPTSASWRGPSADSPPKLDPAVDASARAALNALDPARLMTQLGSAIRPPDLASPITPKVAPPAPAGRAPGPAAVNPIDITGKVLTLASPQVALPKFTGPVDEVHAPVPEDARIDAASRVSLSDLRRILQQGGVGPAPGSGGAGGMAPLPGASAPGAGIALRITPPPAPPASPPLASPAAPRVQPRIPDPPAMLAAVAPPVKTAAIHLDDDFDYQLLVCPKMPDEPGFFGLGGRKFQGEPGWFEVRITPKRSIRRVKALFKDVVWVVDTSESIRDVWVQAVRQGVLGALDTLNEGDRFNIVQFKDTVSVLSESGPLPANAASRALAGPFLSAAKSGGYTDLNRALARLIIRETEPDRVYQIVLISDGKPTRGSIDPRQIINTITRDNDNTAAIHAVGVGDAVDRVLLEFLTYRNKGFVLYPTDAQQAGAAIMDMASQLRYPIVKDAVFNAVGVETGLIYPRLPRDLYQGQTVGLFGRYTDEARRLSMRLTGSSGPDVVDFTFSLNFDQATVTGPETARQWAFWKLHQLYSDMLKEGRGPTIQRQMDDLRDRYKLQTAY